MRLVVWVILVLVLPLTSYATLGNAITLFGPLPKILSFLSTVTFHAFMKLNTTTVMGLADITPKYGTLE